MITSKITLTIQHECHPEVAAFLVRQWISNGMDYNTKQIASVESVLEKKPVEPMEIVWPNDGPVKVNECIPIWKDGELIYCRVKKVFMGEGAIRVQVEGLE